MSKNFGIRVGEWSKSGSFSAVKTDSHRLKLNKKFSSVSSHEETKGLRRAVEGGGMQTSFRPGGGGDSPHQKPLSWFINIPNIHENSILSSDT